MKIARNPPRALIWAGSIALIAHASVFSIPNLIVAIGGPLDQISYAIILVGITLLTFLTVFTIRYARFNLRRQKVTAINQNQILAISPVWAHRLTKVMPGSRFKEPVLVFLRDHLKILDVAFDAENTHLIDYGELSQVCFSLSNVPVGTAGYLIFRLRGQYFKVLTWSPTGNNSAGLRPLLPEDKRDALYNAITRGESDATQHAAER